MKRQKLTAEEKKIEKDLLAGAYRPTGNKEFERVKRAVKVYKSVTKKIHPKTSPR